jgi:hypothetical protein
MVGSGDSRSVPRGPSIPQRLDQACEITIAVEFLQDHLSDAEPKERTIQPVVEFLLESGYQR